MRTASTADEEPPGRARLSKARVFLSRDFLRYLGPGFVVTVGFIDPGNWATNVAGGSGFGYSLLWVITLATLMLILFQSMSARLGIVTGHSLAYNVRERFGRPWTGLFGGSIVLACIATDVAELLGGGAGLPPAVRLPPSDRRRHHRAFEDRPAPHRALPSRRAAGRGLHRHHRRLLCGGTRHSQARLAGHGEGRFHPWAQRREHRRGHRHGRRGPHASQPVPAFQRRPASRPAGRRRGPAETHHLRVGRHGPCTGSGLDGELRHGHRRGGGVLPPRDHGHQSGSGLGDSPAARRQSGPSSLRGSASCWQALARASPPPWPR